MGPHSRRWQSSAPRPQPRFRLRRPGSTRKLFSSGDEAPAVSQEPPQTGHFRPDRSSLNPPLFSHSAWAASNLPTERQRHRHGERDTERERQSKGDRDEERQRHGERNSPTEETDRGRDREAGDRDYGVAFSRDFKLFDRKFAKVVTSYSVVMPHYQRSCL